MGRRAGTEDVPAIAGMGKAAEIATLEMASRNAKLISLRDRLLSHLPANIDHIIVTGHKKQRLPGHASFCVEYIEGESMLMLLNSRGIGVSSGSSCTSRALKASHVLFTVGIENTDEDIDYVLETMPTVVNKLRQMSPLYAKYVKESQGV